MVSLFFYKKMLRKNFYTHSDLVCFFYFCRNTNIEE